MSSKEGDYPVSDRPPLYFSVVWCRRPDLNRHGRSPLPPQDSVSTKFHHFGMDGCARCGQKKRRLPLGKRLDYWSAGGCGCCSSGCSCWVLGRWSVTADSSPLLDTYASVRDVSMNTTAIAVVAFVRNDEAPELPKSAWLPEPPNIAPMLCPLPDCRSTTIIREKQAIR